MKFMLMLYEPERAYQGEAGQKVLAEMLAKHMELARELAAAGVPWSGEELRPTSQAVTVTNQGGAMIMHDGPFAETREQLGGFYVIDVPDRESAVAWAKKMPVVPGGKVEVRPVGGEDGGA